jgi:Carboxypeptidase regulatory-like domain
MKGPAVYLLFIALAGSGCAASPLAPGVPETAEHRGSVDGETVTMSGWVYASATWADPPIADAVVEVTTADGLTTSATSDADGHYELTLPNVKGIAVIRTTKSGYLPESFEATLLKDTVLNFFLSPL